MRQEATKLRAEVKENFDDVQNNVNSIKNNLSKKKSYKSQITDLNTYLFHEGKNYTKFQRYCDKCFVWQIIKTGGETGEVDDDIVCQILAYIDERDITEYHKHSVHYS